MASLTLGWTEKRSSDATLFKKRSIDKSLRLLGKIVIWKQE